MLHYSILGSRTLVVYISTNLKPFTLKKCTKIKQRKKLWWYVPIPLKVRGSTLNNISVKYVAHLLVTSGNFHFTVFYFYVNYDSL